MTILNKWFYELKSTGGEFATASKNLIVLLLRTFEALGTTVFVLFFVIIATAMPLLGWLISFVVGGASFAFIGTRWRRVLWLLGTAVFVYFSPAIFFLQDGIFNPINVFLGVINLVCLAVGLVSSFWVAKNLPNRYLSERY